MLWKFLFKGHTDYYVSKHIFSKHIFKGKKIMKNENHSSKMITNT